MVHGDKPLTERVQSYKISAISAKRKWRCFLLLVLTLNKIYLMQARHWKNWRKTRASSYDLSLEEGSFSDQYYLSIVRNFRFNCVVNVDMQCQPRRQSGQGYWQWKQANQWLHYSSELTASVHMNIRCNYLIFGSHCL